jgi:hypothetical protein
MCSAADEKYGSTTEISIGGRGDMFVESCVQ